MGSEMCIRDRASTRLALPVLLSGLRSRRCLHMDCAMSVSTPFDAPDASAEPVALRRLPFAFAKRHGVLVHLGADGARVVYRPGASLAAVGEALRFVGLPLDVAEVDIATFDQALSEAYQQDSSAAMQMVEGLGDDMDLASLAERLPETEDLMEQEDDAPIIRLINAILSEAVKENASDIHVETLSLIHI